MMTDTSEAPNPKLLAIADRLRAELPELSDPENLLEQGLVYPLFGSLALQLQAWMADGRREELVARAFHLINDLCAVADEEIDNLLQTGLFEVLADQEQLRADTVQRLSDRGRWLYAEILEFLWGAHAVRTLGLSPRGSWGKKERPDPDAMT